jgi:hypothetical protein
MCHVHIANQAVAAVRNRSADCAAFWICVGARRLAIEPPYFRSEQRHCTSAKGFVKHKIPKRFGIIHPYAIRGTRILLKHISLRSGGGFPEKCLLSLVFRPFSRSNHATTSFHAAPVVPGEMYLHTREGSLVLGYLLWRGIQKNGEGQEKNGLDKEFCRC